MGHLPPTPVGYLGGFSRVSLTECNHSLPRVAVRPHGPALPPKGRWMTDPKLPLIHKAPIESLLVHVARSGLVIGDAAWFDRLADGRIGVFAQAKQLILWVVPRRSPRLLGHLGPIAEEIVAPSLAHGDDLRVRIVALVPEHLAHGHPPEIHISVWGDPRHLQPIIAAMTPAPIADPKSTGRLTGLRPA
jgi:hypothetical protein